jgi:tripartite ATP-independent transporter DctM subunit
MEWYSALLLMLGMLVVLLAVGVPVAFAFFFINFAGAWIFLGGEAGMVQNVRSMVGGVALFALAPIPLFILMGEIMFQTGMAGRAIDAIDRLVTRVPGRLSVVAIVSGTVFSALTGSSMANTAMLGSTLIPEMLRRGYQPVMSMGPILGTGGIAVLIPPSGLTVLLGSLASISIADLLIAGIMPGILLALLFVIYVVVRCSINPALAPTYDVPEMDRWQRWRPFLVYVLPLLAIFVVVVGSMLAGIATPTESAALGSVASVIAALGYRSLTWRNLWRSLDQTMRVSVMLFFIIAASITFAQILAFSGATGGMLQVVTSWKLGTYEIMFAMIAVLLVLGCFIEPLSMMMLTLPFFMPLARAAGLDLIWFGVVMLVMLEVSFITPPFGLLLFVMRGLAPPGTSTATIYRAALPYFLLHMVGLALILTFPFIATGLPKFMSR